MDFGWSHREPRQVILPVPTDTKRFRLHVSTSGARVGESGSTPAEHLKYGSV